MNKKSVVIMLLLSFQLYSMNENFHTVSKGESLEKIAKKYKTDIKTLTKLNNIENPNRIYPNMKLKIFSEYGLLGEKYETLGDNVLESREFGLEYKIERGLNYYILARQFYFKDKLDKFKMVDRKVKGLENLKQALKDENVGNIYRIKRQNTIAKNYYKKSWKNFLTYKKIFNNVLPEIDKKIEYIESRLKGEKYEK